MSQTDFTNDELYNFIVEATDSTYAGGGKPEVNPERMGHIEFRYENDKFAYRDSYAGGIRSQGSEYVILKSTGKVIWENGYGGGIELGKESLTSECFKLLKPAMLRKDKTFQSFRGPRSYVDENAPGWEYRYTQKGDVIRYEGLEEILYKGERVFFHIVNGGIVREE